jgi:acetylornithine deacetylase/succinyl-diaminopimelate desuccinylase-like protein
MRRWQLEMLRIPAPPFGEEARAAWMLERFVELGLADPHLDGAGNAVAELPGAAQSSGHACVLLSAHLDTVFPAGTNTEPDEIESRIVCPGACDNAAGLSGLLAIAAAMRHGEIVPAATTVFAANVGEEGEGDLRGMRHLFASGEYARRIAAAIALDGGGSTAVVTRALASRRFRVTVTGPGGHSWMDAGAPNAIMILARGLLAIEELATPDGADAKTTLNVGRIAGGTSVNAIPESAWALVDLRSTETAQLEAAESELRTKLTEAVPAQAVLAIETIGDRPGGALAEGAELMATLRAVDRHLSLRTEPGLGSTDANIPLSLGIPAMAMGAGGVGGGIHTLQEWYDPAGRSIALRRVLLTAMGAAECVATDGELERNDAGTE